MTNTPKTSRLLRILFTFLGAWMTASLAAACGAGQMDKGGFGATPGGVQDMNLARDLVEQGQVPPPEAFVVEAMFSEHDLPLEGAPCSNLLCLQAAMGVAPDSAGGSAAWLQIGMSSSIDPETFVRPSQTIVAVVDVSGSMGWGYESGSAGDLSRQLLHAIAAELDERDQLAMVTFGSRSKVVLSMTNGANHSAINAAIDELDTDGSTNMEEGIETAIPIARAALGETDEVRIMIFSDYNPNVGATGADDFRTLISRAANDGIGTTLLGLGVGLAPEVMKAMSELRGGNAFSATNAEGADTLMADNWPWMVCPLAYDLRINLQLTDGYGIAQTYGFPGETGSASADLEVATVFLSRRRGGMLVKILPSDAVAELGSVGAQLKLDYVNADGSARTDMLQADYAGQSLSASGQYMPQAGAARATALALLVASMIDAAEAYGSHKAEAVTIMTRALARLQADAEQWDDDELRAEIPFATSLLSLMDSGAPQGNLYGNY